MKPAPAPGTPATEASGAAPAGATARPAATPRRSRLTPEERKAIEDAPTFAQLFQARGDAERARREFRRILQIDPNHTEALKVLAEIEAALEAMW